MNEEIIQQIISHPTFLKLKDVVETSAFHDNESAYDHLIHTFDIAKKSIDSPFITNFESKKLFNEYISNEVGSIQKKDAMQLAALLHDIGKALYFKDGGVTSPILVNKTDGKTMCPGHEYRGSILVKDLLKEFNMPEKTINYISDIIRLHDSYSTWYMEPKLDWELSAIINDVKSRGEDIHIELLFNIYNDGYFANIFQPTKKKIEGLFNQLSLYTPREYFVT